MKFEAGREYADVSLEINYNDIGMHRLKQWGEIFAFFAENMLQLQNNFLDFSDILKEEILALNR
ncbi:hypothetical protein [Prolixibacter sp. SD074]|jgi:superfamily I DNA/RNA helicase|uniref:hypothetical protein n=1 Tax=Prolixibacter sp. SD074 TaxID=2652391 RepID=UPI00188FEF50|nr:hypothetical protein [Prolixibacter sp. SD074]